MSTPDSASINCAKIYSNGEYGVDASTVSGPFTLSDVAFDSYNALGEYSYSGTATITRGGCAMAAGMRSGSPMELISYVPQSVVTLGCNNYGGTQLNFQDWRATFRCPTLGDVVIRPEDVKSLPIPLFLAGGPFLLKISEVSKTLDVWL